jgi:cytochrome c oxidase subunit 2
MNFDNPISGCRQVEVIGQQWKFTFNYPNGATDSNLYVEEGQPVQLNMHSVDVLHALFLPTFRTQRNLIPYRQTVIWFIPTELSPGPTGNDPGGWPIFCTQHCGNGHSKMFAHVFVLKKAEFDEKMKELANPFKKKDKDGKQRWVPYEDLGKTLYSQLGCNTCHSITGAAGTGPTWKGLMTRDHEFTNAPPFKASEMTPELWQAYLDESILNPDAKLVKLNGIGYHGMPSSFATLLGGSPENDEKRRAVEEYIKSVGSSDYKAALDPNSELYDAEKHPDFHPESLAGIKARQAGGATPAPGQQ